MIRSTVLKSMRMLTSLLLWLMIATPCYAQEPGQITLANPVPAAQREYYLFGETQIDIDYFDRLQFSSDRPTLTESIRVLPQGELQAEAGYAWAQSEFPVPINNTNFTGNNTVHEVPFLFRFGVLDWLELRAGTGFLTIKNELEHQGSSVFSNKENLTSNFDLGVKAALIDQALWLPEISALAAISIPSGKGSSAHSVVPVLGAIFNWSLNGSLSLRTSLQVTQQEDADLKTDIAYFESIVLEYRIVPQIQAFAEFAASQVDHNDSFGQYNVDLQLMNFGAKFAVNQNIQFDFHAGFGLNKNAADQFFGAGLVIQN